MSISSSLLKKEKCRLVHSSLRKHVSKRPSMAVVSFTDTAGILVFRSPPISCESLVAPLYRITALFSIGFKNQFVKISYKLKLEFAFPAARSAINSASQVAPRIMFLECLQNFSLQPKLIFPSVT